MRTAGDTRQCWLGLAAIFAMLAATPSLHAEDAHPLDAAIEYARRNLSRMDDIRDYSATLLRRQRIDGKLSGYEFAFIKVRHEPFSVYMKFLKPDRVKGREVIYVENQNDGKLLAHEPAFDKLGTFGLAPDGLIAMRGERYPITQVGFRNLAVKLIERAEAEKRKGTSCKVTFGKNAKINNRSATVIEAIRTKRKKDDEFYRVRVFIDDELQIPVRYEAHDWPAKEGGEPVLLEEYTYFNVKLNPGFDDEDFDITNPEYNFPALNLLASPRTGFLFGAD